MRRIVVVGGSIAAVTAAESLRCEGFDGELTVVSGEEHAPYSRVPLSKGVLTGSAPWSSALLPPLSSSVQLRLGSSAVRLDAERSEITLADSSIVPFDGLIIATGSRPRRLARPGQTGELVVRDVEDAIMIARRAETAKSAIVIGGGFLGMEIASTLTTLGLRATVVDRDPPLYRLLGCWLSKYVVQQAKNRGVSFVTAPSGVSLVGSTVAGVDAGPGLELSADLIITAAGDEPNVSWLSDSGLRLAGGGLLIDRCCRVAPNITAAGDVTVMGHPPTGYRRTPHWTSAVEQGRAAARSLLSPDHVSPYTLDPYFWTEQFGCDIKISGELPFGGAPEVVEGNLDAGSALLRWRDQTEAPAMVALNYKVPIVKLKRMARLAG